MKIGNNGNLVWGSFDESTPCLMIVWMNCQTKLRINHLTAVKSVTILEKLLDRNLYVDDLISGSNEFEEALQTSRRAKNIMEAAGMDLRK
ncbi:hypothetical protein TNCV_4202471 [Trichonephila clavipes]|nr:hypothetical protein TNCV_4202471 [Trichonephila clavipes]